MGENLLKNSLYILLIILLLSVVGCSYSIQVSKQLTSVSPDLTQEEENELRKISYQFLENSMQNEIVDEEQATFIGFKSGSKFLVFNKTNSETTDIKYIQAILVTFATKEESKYESINVYFDEKGEKVLGFQTEDR